MVGCMLAGGKGSRWSGCVGTVRALRCTSAWSTAAQARRSWLFWLFSMGQGWSRGGGEAWATSQTRLAWLVLPLACCPHWGDMGALGLFTIVDIGKLTVGLDLS